ncbi:MAG: LON peptidase substrate-binding domain-containing protein [Pseudomonadota bacterium]
MPKNPAKCGLLPAGVNIDYLKKQAKILLRDLQAGETNAMRRARDIHPRPLDPRSAKLSDAQLILAREQGYGSWPKLKADLDRAASAESSAALQDEERMVPMVPLRDLVIFPGAVLPIFIGRQTSLNAVEAALPSKVLLFCTQQDGQIDEIAPGDLYKTGTLVKLLELAKLHDGTVKVLVEGQQTVRIERLELADDYFRATIAVPPSPHRGLSSEATAAARALYLRLAPLLGLAPDVADRIGQSHDPERLTDLAGQNFFLEVEEQQKLLEMTDPVQRFETAYAHLGALEKEIEALDLADYLGRYQIASDLLLNVSLGDGTLQVDTPWDRHVLCPRGHDHFLPRQDPDVPISQTAARSRRVGRLPVAAGPALPPVRYHFVRDEDGQLAGLVRSDWTGAWPTAWRESSAARRGKTEDVAREVMAQHVGRYEHSPMKQKSISWHGGHLNVDGMVLRPLSPYDFVTMDQPIRLSFKLNDRGETIGLRWRAPFESLHFYKMS